MSDDEFQQAADEAYAELLARVGEAHPQPRLDATRRAVELLGDPQRAYPIVHVTGTNGKTSTSRMIESILRAHGLRTGLLTSPHLVRVNERIAIDGEPISNEAFAANWADIRPYLELVDGELEGRGEPPLSFFEALSVLAFASFADAPVDVAVIEVGLGGEWDSTNVADGQVAVFTPIALDHMRNLGNTVEEIARTKSGIVKPAARVVSAAQPAGALAVLRDAAEHNEAGFASEGVDFAVESIAVAVGGQLITLRGRAGEYREMFLPLYGDHQAHNAMVAVAAVESFLGDGTQRIDPDVLTEGLATATSPGRLQLVGVEPTVLVDAAHNPHGAASLAAALTQYFDFDELVFVFGVLGDKDAGGMVDELAQVATRFIVTQADSDRAVPADDLAEIVADRLPEPPTVYPRAEDALADAREWAAEEPRRAVVVAGSIVLIGEVIEIAQREGWKP
ncbi:dihydrofolate synthase/folylpolyglutamate synthase [Diaminobutyricimonas aerilata]|uniref:tetrahydrofolate synthase n=1 Tax=Diaminobutyricimonas aerilata TaxID=1162967 RepID=A0A2M9CJ96_9MICO|nr:folylpolyglutamate synthase/dihydrofolate synthase family protein [Diaminobutyricimonas aerilata]PJJ71962.1 dihydrofolate synthase/folylpolyglutamate synthase [Diaminobutyricimonas aerilata]